MALRRALAGVGERPHHRLGAAAQRPARRRRPLRLGRGPGEDRPLQGHRRRPHAAGSAVRPRLHHRRAAARPAQGRNPGGQRSALGDQFAGEDVRARFRPLHAADAGGAADRGRARLPAATRRGRGQAAPRQRRQGDLPHRCRWHQPRRLAGSVQPDLARAAHGPAVPPRSGRRRQAHRAGRRRIRRRDQPQAGEGRVPLQPGAGRLCREGRPDAYRRGNLRRDGA